MNEDLKYLKDFSNFRDGWIAACLFMEEHVRLFNNKKERQQLLKFMKSHLDEIEKAGFSPKNFILNAKTKEIECLKGSLKNG